MIATNALGRSPGQKWTGFSFTRREARTSEAAVRRTEDSVRRHAFDSLSC
ncbi:hypothetical protein PI95_029525 [Hassallia byssoidea VB512170]|uniref:Uncharacterized protein n=1 Tax=Hassallia byssoidea VB512170 TaxID=1304833 RepID=A0A846HGQ8_9CYAN|nr:hypothetical protein [Hassalia byssoidea]NEU76542.1 hypothetical protein [Hassalia byssoidea VB512170]